MPGHDSERRSITIDSTVGSPSENSNSPERCLERYEKDFRRNFSIGVLNGVLVLIGMAFIHPVYVLPVLLWKITGLRAFAGLILCVSLLGWNWPRMWVSHHLEGRPYGMPVYKLGVVLRSATYLLLVFAVFSLRWGTGWFQAVLIIVLYFAYRSGIGVAAVPFFELVCKTVPVNWRGKFFGTRRVLGGIAAVLAGLLVKKLLGSFPYPQNYFWIFFCGLFGIIIGPILFTFVKEPKGDPLPRTPSFRQHIVKARNILATDSTFRKLVLYNICFHLTMLTRALFGTYCIEQLQMSDDFMGQLVAWDMGTMIVSNLFWRGSLQKRGGLAVKRKFRPSACRRTRACTRYC